MPDEALVTNDAAVHRAFYKQEPYMLDPLDEQNMVGRTLVMSSDQMVAMVQRELAENPAKRKRLRPNQTQEAFIEELRELAARGPEQFELYKAGLELVFTDGVADMVYELRVVHGFSWRAIAQLMSKVVTFPGPQNNQVVGMAMCSLAAERYGQDFMVGGWNRYPETQKAPATTAGEDGEAGADGR